MKCKSFGAMILNACYMYAVPTKKVNIYAYLKVYPEYKK